MVHERRSHGHNNTMKKKAHGHSLFQSQTLDQLSSTNPAVTSNTYEERLQVQNVQYYLRSLSAPDLRSTIWLSSCGSTDTPKRLMKLDGSKFDASMDYKILVFLSYHKMTARYTKWNPLDQEVLWPVLSKLRRVMDIDFKMFRLRITELEQKVRYHMSGEQQIMEHKELMLDVFDYVISQDTTTVAQKAKHVIKRTYCRERSGSQSVGLESSAEKSAASSDGSKNIEDTNIGNVVAKVTTLSLRQKDLCAAIDLLKKDMELRQIITALNDKLARVYLMHVIRGIDLGLD